MKYLLFLLPILIVSCGGEAEVESSTVEEGDTTSVDTVLVETEDTLSLSDFFSPDMVDSLTLLNSNFEVMNSDEAYIDVHVMAHRLLDEMYTDVMDYETDYKTFLQEDADSYYYETDVLIGELEAIEEYMKPIIADCAVECSGLEFLVSFDLLSEAAEQSDGNRDNDFNEICMELFGVAGYDNYQSQRQWIYDFSFEEAAYDFGNGEMLRLVKLLQEFEGNDAGPFLPLIDRYRLDLEDEFDFRMKFARSRSEARGELTEILELNYFSYEGSENINTLLERIDAADEADFNFDPYSNE